MTLMEAVVALVILALVGIGCLELAQGASALEYNATEWNAAITAAESRMAQVSAGAPNEHAEHVDSARINHIDVTREPWRPGLDIISVSVPVTGGKRFTLRKLVASAGNRAVSGASAARVASAASGASAARAASAASGASAARAASASR